MKRNVVVFLILTIIFSGNIYGQIQQKGTIIGKVTDSETGETLIGVNVYLDKTTYGAATDEKGVYKILNVPPGDYTLIASYISYKNYYKKVKIKPDEIVHLDIELELATLMGEEIVVTATRTPSVIKNVPVRTEIISPLEIKKREAKTVYEALETIPGIRVEQQCSNCNFSALRVEGLGGGYAQTLIDGQPIFSGLAAVYGLQQLQTGNIERIEVVKGAGSALYGSNAMGGVVNIIMKKPSPLPEYKFGVNLGSFGTNHFYLNGSQRRKNVGIVFSAQKDLGKGIDQTGGDKPPYLNTGKDNYTDRVESDNFGASSKISWYNPMGENSQLNLSARIISEFRRGGNFNTWDDPFDPDTEHIKTSRYSTGISLSKEYQKGQKLNFDYTYVNHYRNATNGAAWDKPIEAGMMDNKLNLTEKGESYINKYGFAEFRSEWYPKPFIVRERLHLADLRYSQGVGSHLFLTGIQYRKSKLNQNINGTKSDKHADDIGLYLQGDFHFSKKIELVSGIRYDMHKSIDNFTGAKYNTRVFNPRFAFRWNPQTDLTIRANIGTGFRVPYLFSEDLHLCASAPRIYKGKDLKPERAVSFSLGADIYKIRYRAGINIFRTNIKDKVVFVSPAEAEIPPGFDYKWTNLGGAYTQGVEVSFAGLSFKSRLEYNFNFAYTDARLDKPRYTKENYPTNNDGWKYSDHVPRSPNLTGSASFTLSLNGGWQIYSNIIYTGSMYIDHVPDDDTANLIIEKTDGYFILNSKVSKKINGRVSVFIGGKNLLNYTQPKRDTSNAAYMYAPLYGRIIYTGFDVDIR